MDGTNVVEAFELIINEVYRVLRQDGEIEKSLDTTLPNGQFRTNG